MIDFERGVISPLASPVIPIWFDSPFSTKIAHTWTLGLQYPLHQTAEGFAAVFIPDVTPIDRYKSGRDDG